MRAWASTRQGIPYAEGRMQFAPSQRSDLGSWRTLVGTISASRAVAWAESATRVRALLPCLQSG